MTPLNDDNITEDEMLAIMQAAEPCCEFMIMTTASGTVEYIKNDRSWLNDLIEVDKKLKACREETGCLNVATLAHPVTHNRARYTLQCDGLLDKLIEAFLMLKTVFDSTSIALHYRPGPYAKGFLDYFGDCAFLHSCTKNSAPSLSWPQAEHVVSDLNHRLRSWRIHMSSREFHYQCQRVYRNSRNNRKSMTEWIHALFQSHANLQAIRADLGYKKEIAIRVSYEQASAHRAQLCKKFHYYSLFKHLLGCAWKLEWGKERGFHYHFLFFFDASRIKQDITQARRIGELWNLDITDGEGTYYNCNDDAEEKYTYNALGKIAYHHTKKLKGLKCIINYLTKSDEYASLAVTGRTFFHSRAPALPDGPRRGKPRQYEQAFQEVL